MEIDRIRKNETEGQYEKIVVSDHNWLAKNLIKHLITN